MSIEFTDDAGVLTLAKLQSAMDMMKGVPKDVEKQFKETCKCTDVGCKPLEIYLIRGSEASELRANSDMLVVGHTLPNGGLAVRTFNAAELDDIKFDIMEAIFKWVIVQHEEYKALLLSADMGVYDAIAKSIQ